MPLLSDIEETSSPYWPRTNHPRGRPRGKIIPTDIRTILYFDSGVEIDRVRELDATGLMG